MCYSADASLHSFLIGVVGSAALFLFEPALAVFFAFVSLMQFYDYMFWTLPPGTKANYVFTKLAMVSNHLQPLVLAGVTYLKSGLHPMSIAITAAYAIAATVYTTIHYTTVTHTAVSEKSRPGLYWQWNEKKGAAVVYTLFLASFAVVFLQHYPVPLNVALVLVTLATFGTAWYKYKGENAVGRFWCYFGAYVPGVLALYYSFASALTG